MSSREGFSTILHLYGRNTRRMKIGISETNKNLTDFCEDRLLQALW